jgi:hypothetical protein
VRGDGDEAPGCSGRAHSVETDGESVTVPMLWWGLVPRAQAEQGWAGCNCTPAGLASILTGDDDTARC